jgi:hypothetical protein
MLGELESLAAVTVWLVVGGVLALVVNFVRTARWALLPLRHRSQQSGSHANETPIPALRSLVRSRAGA